jgi:uroporphyrinogen decarboxylase
MNSRERLITALKHKEPDRVPIDIGQSAVTGITQKAYKNLLKYLGKDTDKIIIHDTIQQLATVDEDIAQKFGVDIRGYFFDNPTDWELIIKDEGNYTYFTDAWGVVWRMPKENGLYYDLWKHPLMGDSIEDLKKFKWPNPTDNKRIKNMVVKAKKTFEEGNYAVGLGQAGMTPGYLQEFQWLQGFNDSFINLAGNPAFTNASFDKLLELDLTFWEWFLPQAGKYLDVISQADDVAGQNGLLISKEMFQKYLKPRYKKLYNRIHKLAPDLKVNFHSCGAIFDIIPDLIEMGIDILNPVQLSARGMDIKKIKKEFGKDITLWGGGIDTQSTLPHGTLKQIREEVKRNLDILMPGGGYVFNTVHNIQSDVPPQNIIEMMETVLEFGKY